jgi:peroxiredoxin
LILALACALAAAPLGMELPQESAGGADAAALEADPEALIEEGHSAPDFDLPRIGGGRVSLAEMRGRQPLLVVLWAVWCPPCVQEFEELKRLHRAFSGRGLAILAVGVRYHQSLEEVREFARDRQVDFPVLYDESERFVQQYGVGYIPTNFLIDRDGVVRLRSNGLGSDIDARVEEVLGGAQG